jgi:4-amino-4-deoxy-L-arabinose transferase-like glycosyltransferase
MFSMIFQNLIESAQLLLSGAGRQSAKHREKCFCRRQSRLIKALMFEKIRRWTGTHPNWTLALVVTAFLAPFLCKPFNIDDPLFIWIAHQIQLHPGDPYGFNVNWYGTVAPMWAQTENPPLASYYIALAAGIFGWSELALHLAFLLPAIAAILGTYRLARRFCDWPVLAACATLFTPVFLVSSTTVMCDVLMLTFWVWAIVFWVEGTERENFRQLSGAGLLIAFAALTKYYGVCLIPLLAVYSLIKKRRLGRWAACLLIPLASLCAYQWFTRELYGQAMFSKAVGFTSSATKIIRTSHFASSLTALTFTGGCLAVAVFFAPLIWRVRALMWFAASAMLIAAAVYFQNGMLRANGPLAGEARAFAEIQTVFWAVGGAGVLALAVGDFLKRRDANAALLAFWIFGTFFFAAFFNWTVSGRSILPMAPAVGILLARRLGEKTLVGQNNWTRGVIVSFAISAALAYLVAQSDFLLAIAVRQSALETFTKYGGDRGAFWYEGHWGFQYYMDLKGAAGLDLKYPALKAGDTLAMPAHNSFIFQPKPETADVREIITVQGPRLLTTWSEDVGAGFYSSVPGPLPFAFGHVPPENVAVYFWKVAAPASPKK